MTGYWGLQWKHELCVYCHIWSVLQAWWLIKFMDVTESSPQGVFLIFSTQWDRPTTIESNTTWDADVTSTWLLMKMPQWCFSVQPLYETISGCNWPRNWREPADLPGSQANLSKKILVEITWKNHLRVKSWKPNLCHLTWRLFLLHCEVLLTTLNYLLFQYFASW